MTTNNRAFASHPEQGHWDLATLLEREEEEWFDPEGFLVLEVRRAAWPAPVGRRSTPTRIRPWVRSTSSGWIRSSTAAAGDAPSPEAGLDWLAGRGCAVGMLYVDADNVAAVSLYRSMGFVEAPRGPGLRPDRR